MLPEKWRVIPSHPIYEASTRGRVRSKFRVRKLHFDDDGRPIVALYVGGGTVTVPVARLVCEAFHGIKPTWAADAKTIRGIADVRPRNVCWTIVRQQRKRNRGQCHPHALFTKSQIMTIRAQYKASPTAATIGRLAQAFAVTKMTIRRIARGQSWKE